MDSYRKLLGDNLRRLRKAKGLSQEAFSLRCDIDRTYISGIERGIRNPSLDTLIEIAKTLDVTLAELLSNLTETVHNRQ